MTLTMKTPATYTLFVEIKMLLDVYHETCHLRCGQRNANSSVYRNYIRKNDCAQLMQFSEFNHTLLLPRNL